MSQFAVFGFASTPHWQISSANNRSSCALRKNTVWNVENHLLKSIVLLLFCETWENKPMHSLSLCERCRPDLPPCCKVHYWRTAKEKKVSFFCFSAISPVTTVKLPFSGNSTKIHFFCKIKAPSHTLWINFKAWFWNICDNYVHFTKTTVKDIHEKW